jgi:hypothetical protein
VSAGGAVSSKETTSPKRACRSGSRRRP